MVFAIELDKKVHDSGRYVTLFFKNIASGLQYENSFSKQVLDIVLM